MIKNGAVIVDIGGESTRPGAKDVNKSIEWKRINKTLKKVRKLNKFISLDTRKSWIMEKGIKNKVNLINDVSGFTYDAKTIYILAYFHCKIKEIKNSFNRRFLEGILLPHISN